MKRVLPLLALLLALPGGSASVASAATPGTSTPGDTAAACKAATPALTFSAGIKGASANVQGAVETCAAAIVAASDGAERLALTERLLAVVKAAASRSDEDIQALETLLSGAEPGLSLSRASRVALIECLRDTDAVMLPPALVFKATTGSEATKGCDDAMTNISVDGAGKNVLGELNLAIASRNLLVANAGVSVALGTPVDVPKLQAELIANKTAIGDILKKMGEAPL